MATRKWIPSEHASERWCATIPAKLSETAKRRDQYFGTKKEGEKFIWNTLGEREEHGKQTVSSEERYWIQVAIEELENLDKPRDVQITGRGVQEINAPEATELFVADRSTVGLNPKTKNDIRCRVRGFGTASADSPLHQTPRSVMNASRRFIQFLRNWSAF
jgi:hypothetical protein